MIKLYAVNVDKEILNKLKDVEVYYYYADFSLPVIFIYKDDELIYKVYKIEYDRINACILELRR